MNAYLPGFIARQQNAARHDAESCSQRPFLTVSDDEPQVMERLHTWLPMSVADDRREQMDDLWNHEP